MKKTEQKNQKYAISYCLMQAIEIGMAEDAIRWRDVPGVFDNERDAYQARIEAMETHPDRYYKMRPVL